MPRFTIGRERVIAVDVIDVARTAPEGTVLADIRGPLMRRVRVPVGPPRAHSVLLWVAADETNTTLEAIRR